MVSAVEKPKANGAEAPKMGAFFLPDGTEIIAVSIGEMATWCGSTQNYIRGRRETHKRKNRRRGRG